MTWKTWACERKSVFWSRLDLVSSHLLTSSVNRCAEESGYSFHPSIVLWSFLGHSSVHSHSIWKEGMNSGITSLPQYKMGSRVGILWSSSHSVRIPEFSSWAGITTLVWSQWTWLCSLWQRVSPRETIRPQDKVIHRRHISLEDATKHSSPFCLTVILQPEAFEGICLFIWSS